MSTDDFTAAIQSITENIERRDREIADLKETLIARLEDINARDRRIRHLEKELNDAEKLLNITQQSLARAERTVTL